MTHIPLPSKALLSRVFARSTNRVKNATPQIGEIFGVDFSCARYLSSFSGGHYRDNARAKSPLWLSFASLPLRERARINPEFTGKILLREPACFPVCDELLGDSGSSWQGIVSKEFDHFCHVNDARSRVSLFPIYDRHLVATDPLCYVTLPKVKVETAFADCLADGLWGGRIALCLCKIWPVGNPCGF